MNFWNYDIVAHNEICVKCDQPILHPNFWKEIWRYWIKWLKYDAFHKSSLCKQTKSIVFITSSINNTRTLEPVWSRLKSGDYSIIDSDQDNDTSYYRWKQIAGYSFFYIYPLIKSYLRATDWEKKIMRNDSGSFFITMGVMVITRNLMKQNNIQLAVMANDHNPIQRAWGVLAPKYGVKTMYLQHCSITEKFPSLQFTYSFLDGEESLHKYLNIGNTKGIIYVSGNPRFDAIHGYKIHDRSTNKIGLAINELDSEDLVKELCLNLQKNGALQIVLRPHPRQELCEIDWYNAHQIEISDSKTESVYDFLARIRMLIASESGIHLDAVMMGVYSVCYSLTGRKAMDWYSYIKNGLIPNAETQDELLELLQPKNIASEEKLHAKAQWYNASYGRKTEGHVGEMIADFIQYEQSSNIADFDRKYGFVVKEHTDQYIIKVYAE